jgi:hypothetical protein
MFDETVFKVLLAITEFILLIGTGFNLTKLVGNRDNAAELAGALTPIMFLLGVIVFLHTLLWYMYFTYNPIGMNLYFLISSAITMFVSLIALSVSLTQQV